MNLADLQLGVEYIFHTHDFHAPTGELIPGEAKRRRYMGTQHIVALGKGQKLCLAVQRHNGKAHLLSVAAIRAVELAAANR